MCPYCRASSVDRARAWTDFGPEAGWQDTRWTHEAYIAYLTAMGLAIPILFTVVIGFRLECVTVDPLHCVDQGVASHVIGNIIWIIAVVRNVFGGRTYDIRMSNCAANLKALYKTTKAKYPLQGKLTLERVRATGDWPKLRAKAAQTRKLAVYALYLISTFGQPASLDEFTRNHDQLALGVAQLLVRFYEILDSESQFMRSAAADELANVGNTLGNLYSQLSSMSFRRGLRLW